MSSQYHSSVAVAILASGSSSRETSQKFARFQDEALVRPMIEKVNALGCGRVGVVLGAHIDDILPELDGFDVSLIINDGWRSGLGTSLRTAVQWAITRPCEALLVVLVDQVDVTTQHLSALLNNWRVNRNNVGSEYDGVVGVPAVFDATSFAQILQLDNADIGARFLLRQTQPQTLPRLPTTRDVDAQAEVLSPTGSY